MNDRMVTSCKGCVFAATCPDTPEYKQGGCALNRHELLGVKSLQDNYFVLEEFCSTFRPQEWLDGLVFEDQLNSRQVVLDEIYPRMGYFVKFDNTLDEPIAKLRQTLKSIAEASYKTQGMPMFIVVVNDKVEYNEEIWTLFLAQFQEVSDTDYHIVQINEEMEDRYFIDEAFIHAKNAWIHTLTSGQEVPSNINDKLHEIINIKMEKLALVEPYNEFDGFLFPAFLFKFLNGNRVKVFIDEQVDAGTFLEKVKSAEGRSDAKTVYTWEEFYAS